MSPARAQQFTFADLPREQVKPTLSRAAVRGDQSMVVANWIEPHPTLAAPHSHPFDQLALVVRGTMLFDVDGETFTLGAGDILVIPADAPHCARATGKDPALNLDVFAPPREDYLHLVEHQHATGSEESRS